MTDDWSNEALERLYADVTADLFPEEREATAIGRLACKLGDAEDEIKELRRDGDAAIRALHEEYEVKLAAWRLLAVVAVVVGAAGWWL